tara:strand:- start:199 stop:417 length:219 start_codon:yes stop_codon:yes gene_type:complete
MMMDTKKGIAESIKSIDEHLVKIGADHPGDIIADILHWCDKYNEDFDNLIETGRGYYEEEKEVDKANSICYS